MAAPMNVLSELLLQKSFAECTQGELAQLTEQYPYFAPAHFLLLKKLDPASDEYRRQYQKALLYHHDPVSFEFFLNRDIAIVHGDLPVATPAPVATEPVSIEEHAVGTVDEELEHEESGDPDDTDAPLPFVPKIDLQAAPTGDISFEPYHTVDYFASQGIKLSQEEFGKDKFGKQLKSFTEWLKTMKRVPADTKNTAADARSEAKVEGMAGESVQESNIVTESMAEVWIKQGNKAKAAEIYRKLSLLYPAKSAYFADKINTLND
jgi:hypothetical protein